ncbi:MAG TPA: MFS transporter [Solirubrobacteraceae bacterium]|nr:MFS transporter [Solirubrobacteraceae bacterium]
MAESTHTGTQRLRAAATASTGGARGANRALVLVSLLIAAFAINLDTTIVNVALPTLVRKLHASDSQLQWVVDAYNLVFAALLLACGGLSDKLGRKGVLLAGLAVFGLGSVAGGLTDTPGQLIAARSVMGLGAALVFPATLSLISNVFTERGERARAIGLWGATAGMAIALGPIVGGWLIERSSWPAIFFAMAPVAALGAALVAYAAPRSRDPQAPPADVRGFALSTAAMALLTYTIIEAPEHGWGSARTLASFAAALALLAGFVAWERRTPQPMLDMGLFRIPRFTAASGSVTVAFFALFGFIFLMTQYFQFIKSYGPLSTGVHLLPVATAVGVSSVLGTKLAVRVGTKAVVAAGLLLMAGFYLWVAAAISPAYSYGAIAVQMVVFGTGMGFTSAPATEAIMGVVPEARAGIGSAVNDATRLLGGTLGVAVIGSVYASLYGNRLASTLPAHLPAALARTAHQSIGAALAVSGKLATAGRAPLAATVHDASTGAFIHGLSAGCIVAGALSLAGAAAVAALLPAQPPQLPDAAAAVAVPVPAQPRADAELLAGSGPVEDLATLAE